MPDVDHHESQAGRPGQLSRAGERVLALAGLVDTDDKRSLHDEPLC